MIQLRPPTPRLLVTADYLRPGGDVLWMPSLGMLATPESVRTFLGNRDDAKLIRWDDALLDRAINTAVGMRAAIALDVEQLRIWLGKATEDAAKIACGVILDLIGRLRRRHVGQRIGLWLSAEHDLVYLEMERRRSRALAMLGIGRQKLDQVAQWYEEQMMVFGAVGLFDACDLLAVRAYVAYGDRSSDYYTVLAAGQVNAWGRAGRPTYGVLCPRYINNGQPQINRKPIPMPQWRPLVDGLARTSHGSCLWDEQRATLADVREQVEYVRGVMR